MYKLIKHDISAERYVRLNLSSSQRSFVAQLRFGILPIRVETGRFINLPLKDRICQQCTHNDIEDEIHFLFYCPLYRVERNKFFTDMLVNCPHFLGMSDVDKLIYCNNNETRKFAKFVKLIYKKRTTTLYVAA